MRFRVSVAVALAFLNAPLVFAQSHSTAVDERALSQLLGAAQAAHSDAVVIYHEGDLVGAWYFDNEPQKIEAMSITKSIVNLAVGRLITTGQIDSLDVPVHTFYPEWKQGRKQNVTIRHLLNHTSGVQNVPNAGLEIEPAPDVVQLALAAELSDDPGEVFSYNNKAMNLLAGIVETASGKRMDRFLREDLFRQMGIIAFEWLTDEAGNPYAMAGFRVYPEDLAKLGQLVLDRGMWNGEQLIAQSWFAESLSPGSEHSPTYGLLWWLLPERTTWVIDAEQIDALRAGGVDSDFLARAERMIGRYSSRGEYDTALEASFGEDWQRTLNANLLPRNLSLSRREYGEIIGYEGNGWLGQYLVIYPDQRLVGVRMVQRSEDYDSETDTFADFRSLVRNLVRVGTHP